MEQQDALEPDKQYVPNATTVMVVDDDDNWIFISKCMLQIAGVQEDEVVSAKNGLEALHMLRDMVRKGEQLPSILLLDLKMPVMDGFELLDALTTTGEFNLRNTRIYMCSSSIYGGDKEKAYSYPIVDFLVKPLSIETFQEIVR